MKEKPGTYYPFLFYDVMGLENGINKGVYDADIVKALKGHVKEGYMVRTEHSNFSVCKYVCCL